MKLGIAVSGAHPVSVPSEPHVTTTTPHVEESESFHSTSHSVPIHHSTINPIATHSIATSAHVTHSSGNSDDNDSSYQIGLACIIISLTLMVVMVVGLYKLIKSL
ncbi:hypothetical protein [Bacillus smithii]|uniref:hypothetical protein n=1 Tax=Bacillus smithii TaxID=1479 RepID=UPI00077C0693|nr:hypothetical protein [Bacillus smithii]